MTTALRDFVQVLGQSHRSVQLARDWERKEDLSRYILTPTARDLAMRICAGIRTPQGPRAWSITGPYGVGKSAFALFLTDVLGSNRPRHPEAAALRAAVGSRFRRFVPVLLVGRRAPFVPSFLTTLSQSLRPLSRSIASKAEESARKGRASDRLLVETMEEAANVAHEKGSGGLLVVIDEFGKFLEYAALHPETEDLLVLQHLAETAARSPVPIVLATILHTAFAEYLKSVDEAQRAEWQKVQGRFVDVAFLEPPEQMLGLIGASLKHSFPEPLRLEYRHAVEHALHSPALRDANQRFPLSALLPSCVPLHPTTALLLWPLFRSKLAQHERSLFAFLTTPEPFGVQDFLSSATWNRSGPPFYRVDRLWDYVTTSLGAATYRGEQARRWAEIDHALTRIGSDAPPLAQAVVKVVGLLSIYGKPVGLRPSQSGIALALDDPEAVSLALRYLERRSILIYRKHEASYALWEGSDVDLGGRFEEGQRHVGHAGLAARLKRNIVLRPMVARAHYFKTGVLRYFTVDVIDGKDSTLREAFEGAKAIGDGRILYVLTPSRGDREALIEAACSLTKGASPEQKLKILAFPRPVLGMEEALQELEAWRWVSENTPALQGDPVARQEVRARMMHAWEHLESVAGRVLGLRGYAFDPEAVDWVQGGTRRNLSSSQAFQRWLSSLCDEVYAKTPMLHNELLNRSQLSSAATAARRTLLESMIVRPGELRLGFQGTPPEASMYEALLANGGFHRVREGHLGLGEPKGAWRPVWKELGNFLASTRKARRRVEELFTLLKKPPYGLREGVFPVVLCAVLLSHRDDVALYEDGVFVPELRIEVLERLIKAPQLFEIQQYVLSTQDQRVFGVINKATRILGESTDQNQPRLLQVVKPLVLFAAHLPAYTRYTTRLKAETLAVRDALLNAKDPYELLFRSLPAATGVPLHGRGDLAKFGHVLRGCLQELRLAYPHLLDEIEGFFRQAFGLAGTYEEARKQLQTRVVPLEGFATDRTLALFVREASRIDDRDWREVLARVIQGGLPPAQWPNPELQTFVVKLQKLRSDFIKLEELVAEQRRTGASLVFRIGLLDGRAKEAREVISLTSENALVVSALADRIDAILSQPLVERAHEDRQLRLAVLAQVAARYLLETEAKDE